MTNNKLKVGNVPNLRFPGFEGNENSSYREYFFKDIFLFSTGKNIKQNEASPAFETPCVRYGELYHMYNEVISEIVNKTNLNKSELLFSQGDEILLPSAGEDPLDIGSASALTIENVAIGRTINILRPMMINVYSHIYVSYYINQKLRKKISTLAKGVSISNVYNSDLRTLEIVLPTLPEQKKISDFLIMIDERIQTQNKIIEQLETLIKGLSEKLFSEKIRLKKFTNEWELKSLGEICEFHKGNPLSKNDIVTDGSLKCIHYGELFTTYKAVILDIISYTNNDGFKSEMGDILMPSSDVTPLGLATASTILEDNVVLGSDINILRPRAKINSIFLSYLLNSEKKKIIQLVSGTTVKHIYNKDLRQIKVHIPFLEEQTTIAQFLSVIDSKIQTEKDFLLKYKSQKKYLLQNIFI